MVTNLREVLERRKNNSSLLKDSISNTERDKVAALDKTAAANVFFEKIKNGSFSKEESDGIKTAVNRSLEGFFSLLHRR